MHKIRKKMVSLEMQRRIGLMTHVVVGYPNLEETARIVKAMVAAGVDFMELQIPFSDPVADGLTIMEASKIALEKGIKVKDCLSFLAQMTQKYDIPFLVMSYYNLIFNYGVEDFCQAAQKAGASGLIVPDIIPDEEEKECYYQTCQNYDLYPIAVVSPTSTKKRLQNYQDLAQGFVYCTARLGTTGAKEEFPSYLSEYLTKVRRELELPLAVGFGISQKKHVDFLRGKAEIAVVGSALIDCYRTAKKSQKINALQNFIYNLKGA